MYYSNILFSKSHLLHPFTLQGSGGEKISISDKKASVIALSVLTGALTFGIGGVVLFYTLSAKYKVDRLTFLEKKTNHLLHQQLNNLPALPKELFALISNELSSEDMNRLSQVNRTLRNRGNEQLLKRAKSLGYEGSDTIQSVNKFLSSLYETVRTLENMGFLPKDKLVYRQEVSEGHKMTKVLDVEKTVQNFQQLRMDELMFIYNIFASIFTVKDIGLFNKLLSLSSITQVENINKDELNELLACSIYQGDANLAKLLLEQGADPNKTNDQFGLPLILAAEKGYFKIVQLLIEHNADINAQKAIDGSTALMTAIWTQNVLLVRYLLEKGADQTIADNRHITPRHQAQVIGKASILELLQGAEA